MRRTAVVLIIFAAMLAVAFGFGLYLLDPSSFVWHLHHGFHANAGGVKLRVPFFYRAVVDSSDGLVIAGRVRTWREDSTHPNISMISFCPSGSTGGCLLPSAQAGGAPSSDRKALTKIGGQQVLLAGIPGECVEYKAEPLKVDDVARSQVIVDMIEISCQFRSGDVMSLLGSPAAAPNFYEMIESAKPAKEMR